MTIPLDPGRGGRSIGLDALRPADIIVSTTDAAISQAIRAASGSSVSHAILYAGQGKVVEAIGEGVVERRLSQAVDDASLAVAYRRPNLNHEQAQRIVAFARQQVGKAYDTRGLAGHGLYTIARGTWVRAGILSDDDARLNTEIQDDDAFFCSELVMAAYAQGGDPLVRQPAHTASPDDLANLRLNGSLRYVGHLVG